MNLRQLILGSWVATCVASTLLLCACGGKDTTPNPLPVEAGVDAAADAPHDAAADAPLGDASPIGDAADD